ncbi:dihydroorotate dehydrogenase (quinone) [Meridianimarinicoccus roseus]|jgi:dihydroorotate dehydrogenase|uniref:Dihydroorotate dehydrogenase (quinone) n=1 Tax=Meridianimarinicoccus roseus TaxID=2072018 RepID=A0A2V2LI03_9RHOB|nr:quinone-dependent dihydroorotate dehydrogenase [Meridianimarinicoccus roseus]PWR01503.1 dihydroorotate dehydrogenase (quinone) [Meridianimarinicoccus roseus]
MTTLRERVGLAALHRLDPETAHGLALRALRAGLVPLPGPVQGERLRTRVAGLDLPNPVGLAAGFDKNADVVPQLCRAGFGFIELGGTTPRPQVGNPRPRLFRLTRDRAVINRFGLNGIGAAALAERLRDRPSDAVIGLNLGANKDSADRSRDYVEVLNACAPHVDYVTVNVSSPNTENLRELQGRAALWALLTGVMDARGQLDRRIPVFVKIAPDLNGDELADIAEVALASSVDGIVATNTTVLRAGLKGRHRNETGGLSGAPLFERSTHVLAQLSKLTGGALPLIGVGGISNGAQAYEKIRAGASAVQLYSALVFQGMSLVPRIAADLDALLARDGFGSVADAVGSGRDDWL